MTQLLVSVRNAAEAEIALAGGASIIDVKEPNHGSLGRADRQTLQEVVAELGGRVPLSAALGELATSDAPLDLPEGFQFAKIGLAGMAKLDDWQARWCRQLQALPAETASVAVVYADWQDCNAPPPEEVIHAADHQNCAAVLIDTYGKQQGDLFSYFSLEQLAQLVEGVQTAGMRIVLAGSLSAESLTQACLLKPDLVAVRGAVCGRDRTTSIDQKLVIRVAEQVATATHHWEYAWEGSHQI